MEPLRSATLPLDAFHASYDQLCRSSFSNAPFSRVSAAMSIIYKEATQQRWAFLLFSVCIHRVNKLPGFIFYVAWGWFSAFGRIVLDEGCHSSIPAVTIEELTPLNYRESIFYAPNVGSESIFWLLLPCLSNRKNYKFDSPLFGPNFETDLDKNPSALAQYQQNAEQLIMQTSASMPAVESASLL